MTGRLCTEDIAILRLYVSRQLTQREAADLLNINERLLLQWVHQEGMAGMRRTIPGRRQNTRCACGNTKAWCSTVCRQCYEERGRAALAALRAQEAGRRGKA